jgi:hypothetical protein
MLDTAQALASDAITVAAPTASAPKAGAPIADHITNSAANSVPNGPSNNNAPSLTPSFTPNLTPNANAPAPIVAPIAATTIDVPSKNKPDVSAQPVVAVPPQATTAAQTGSVPETGLTTAEKLTNNIAYNDANNPPSNNATHNNSANNPANNASPFSPDLASNSKAPAPTPGSIAATTNDVPSQPSASVQPASAATLPATAADKKTSAAVQPNVQLNATLSHDVPAAVAAGSEPSATLSVPAAPASALPSPVTSDAAPEVPKAHQMLDSAPPAPLAVPAAPIAPGPAADSQLNTQMHLGMRTDAFGAVEIHTVIQQSQVGITVHSDRDIARWFSSEVPGLESGLSKSHLNLTAVDFDNGRSGVQTATSFQQDQPRQSFSQTAGSAYAASEDQDAAPESVTVDILPSDLSAGPVSTHVSIHV